MRRREFVSLIGGAAVTWPLAARAELARNVARIGYLSPTAGRNPNSHAFEGTLQQLGWVKGHNVIIEYRHTGGRQDTVAPLVAEIVGLGVDVIVGGGRHCRSQQSGRPRKSRWYSFSLLIPLTSAWSRTLLAQAATSPA
jgi:hypothetical protein